MNENSKKVLSNFLWRFFERCGAQLVKLVVELILARILLPEDYGTIALITVFINVLNVFVDSGLGNALIQKKDADDVDFSSVFYFNLVWCLVLYLLLFLSSPLIASFYSRPEIVPVIRVLGLTIIVSGVKNVQQAYVSCNLLFKRFFFATLGGTIGAAGLGITLAYLGFGVWALVAQQLFNVTVDTLILWITVKWRPKKVFSFERMKSLFSFGWKLLVSGLIDTVYTNIRSLIIGKVYSSEDLAFYNQGEKYPYVIVGNINNSIDSVLFPTMSKQQDNPERVKELTRRAIKTSTYIMAPLMIGIAVTSESIVELLLTEKWLPCVFFLRVFCISFMFQPVHTANLNAIKAMGKSNVFLKLEIMKKVVGMIILVSTMFISVKALALSSLLSNLIFQIINSFPNNKLLNYGYLEQVKDFLPGILLAGIMGGAIYPLTYLHLGLILTIILQLVAGAAIYIGVSYILKLDTFMYLFGLMKGLIQKFMKKEKV